MNNKSTSEGKSQYQLDKDKIRFNPINGQHQGPSSILQKDFIIKGVGLYPFAVHLGLNK